MLNGLNMTLYKYRAIDKNTLNILINREIFFPLSKYFNDPFDSQLLPGEYIESLIKMGVYDTESSKLFDEALLKKKQETYGVYCLSKESKSILMWSHYAVSHKGICFGFKNDFSKYIESDSSIETINVDYLPKGLHVFSEIYERILQKSHYNSSDAFNNFL